MHVDEALVGFPPLLRVQVKLAGELITMASLVMARSQPPTFAQRVSFFHSTVAPLFSIFHLIWLEHMMGGNVNVSQLLSNAVRCVVRLARIEKTCACTDTIAYGPVPGRDVVCVARPA